MEKKNQHYYLLKSKNKHICCFVNSHNENVQSKQRHESLFSKETPKMPKIHCWPCEPRNFLLNSNVGVNFFAEPGPVEGREEKKRMVLKKKKKMPLDR